MLGQSIKQPADHLDYDITFEDWLPDGDTIVSASTSLDIAGELVVTNTLVLSPIVKVWVSGGVDGKTYKLTVLATTQQGRVKEVEFKLRVKDF